MRANRTYIDGVGNGAADGQEELVNGIGVRFSAPIAGQGMNNNRGLSDKHRPFDELHNAA